MRRSKVFGLAVVSIVAVACSDSGEADKQSPDSEESSVRLLAGSVDWIQGCGAQVQSRLVVELVADAEAILHVDVAEARFVGWWQANAGYEVTDESAKKLPIEPGQTATLEFVYYEEGSLGQCSLEDLPPPVPLEVSVVVNGAAYSATATGHVGCGWDEEPEGGC